MDGSARVVIGLEMLRQALCLPVDARIRFVGLGYEQATVELLVEHADLPQRQEGHVMATAYPAYRTVYFSDGRAPKTEMISWGVEK